MTARLRTHRLWHVCSQSQAVIRSEMIALKESKIMNRNIKQDAECQLNISPLGKSSVIEFQSWNANFTTDIWILYSLIQIRMSHRHRTSFPPLQNSVLTQRLSLDGLFMTSHHTPGGSPGTSGSCTVRALCSHLQVKTILCKSEDLYKHRGKSYQSHQCRPGWRFRGIPFSNLQAAGKAYV